MTQPPVPDTRSMMAAFLARRAEVEQQELVALRASLLAALPGLVEELVAAGAAQVWLFGSLAMGEVHARSDIDLAVAGLPADAYFRVLGRLLARAPGLVDLVELESAPESLREVIVREGRQLHPAGAP
jgi:predicted nucleotidyltransferase